jgi:hypothetical protein
MIITYEDGRQIQIESVHGEMDDIQIDGAFWIDTGEDIEDEIVYWIYENCYDSLYDMWFEKQIAAIDFME